MTVREVIARASHGLAGNAEMTGNTESSGSGGVDVVYAQAILPARLE